MPFNPLEHLIEIRGGDYLEVKWRLVWMREEHPDWSVQTTLLDGGDPVIVKAAIADENGHIIATGHAEFPRGKPFPPTMKCETSAIGRALAHAGYGTQFAGEDVEEADIVDAPMKKAKTAAPKKQGRGTKPKAKRPAPTKKKAATNAKRPSWEAMIHEAAKNGVNGLLELVVLLGEVENFNHEGHQHNSIAIFLEHWYAAVRSYSSLDNPDVIKLAKGLPEGNLQDKARADYDAAFKRLGEKIDDAAELAELEA